MPKPIKPIDFILRRRNPSNHKLEDVEFTFDHKNDTVEAVVEGLIESHIIQEPQRKLAFSALDNLTKHCLGKLDKLVTNKEELMAEAFIPLLGFTSEEMNTEEIIGCVRLRYVYQLK